MKGLTKSQLLEYVTIKRDYFFRRWAQYNADGNVEMAERAWEAYNVLDCVRSCMTDKNFGRLSYEAWTGKEP